MCFDEEKRAPLNSMIIENIKDLVMNSNGICVVKRLITTNESEENKMKIYKHLCDECLEIIQSPFGNYAIQCCIEVIKFKKYKNIKPFKTFKIPLDLGFEFLLGTN